MKHIEVSGVDRNLVSQSLEDLNKQLQEMSVNALAIGYVDEDGESRMYFWYSMSEMMLKELKGCTIHLQFDEAPHVIPA